MAPFKSYTEDQTVGNPPLSDYRDINTWEHLSNEECTKAYAQTYITGRADVVAISSAANTSVPLRLAYEMTELTMTGNADLWVCSSFQSRACDIGALKRDASDWRPNDTRVVDEDGDIKLASAQYPH